MHGRGQLDAFEPRARELEQRLRIAPRSEQSDLDARRRAALVAEHQRETLHAAVARDEERCQSADQALQRKRERAVRFDAERKFETAFEPIGGR
jgi:hypothetical protein